VKLQERAVHSQRLASAAKLAPCGWTTQNRWPLGAITHQGILRGGCDVLISPSSCQETQTVGNEMSCARSSFALTGTRDGFPGMTRSDYLVNESTPSVNQAPCRSYPVHSHVVFCGTLHALRIADGTELTTESSALAGAERA
jgi:hypothetical protein